jgi:fibro-slime domain-containing protein
VGQWLVGLALCACGRSELLTAAPCSVDGSTLGCEGTCGDGVVTCRRGYWGACEVPATTRTCENACGAGSETCRDGVWGTCEVAPVERSCTATCGDGAETCTNGVWGTCEVAPVELPCSNACGDGVEYCQDGLVGDCEVQVKTRDCSTVCGDGHEACVNGAWQACDAPEPQPPLVHTTIRDFQASLDGTGDFEHDLHGQDGDDPYIVGPLLGSDDTPVYTGDPRIHTVQSAYSFYEWYHDTPISIVIPYDIQLQNAPDRPGFFVYDNSAFFPIDNQGWGNDGNPHNYHFTLAAELSFRYGGGEVFSLGSDDDGWMFVNRHLAINLGGMHTTESASVMLDDHRDEFGLELGGTYPIHLFYAERHTVSASFMLETSDADAGSCP